MIHMLIAVTCGNYWDSSGHTKGVRRKVMPYYVKCMNCGLPRTKANQGSPTCEKTWGGEHRYETVGVRTRTGNLVYVEERVYFPSPDGKELPDEPKE